MLTITTSVRPPPDFSLASCRLLIIPAISIPYAANQLFTIQTIIVNMENFEKNNQFAPDSAALEAQQSTGASVIENVDVLPGLDPLIEQVKAKSLVVASTTVGDPEAFENDLHEGKLLAERLSAEDKAHAERHRAIKREKQNSLKAEKAGLEAESEKINQESIPNLEKLVKGFEDALRKLNEDYQAGKLMSDFSIIRFSLLTFLLVCNLSYLLIYYANLLFAIFFKDYGKIISSKQVDLNALLGSVFDPTGIFEWKPILVFCYLAPTIFLTLGLAPHLFLKAIGHEKYKSWIKAALYLIAFIFDSLLAFQLEKRAYEMRKLIYPDTQFEWITSPMFWTVLGFGFIAYAFCGLLIMVVGEEYEKRDPKNLFKSKLKNLEDNISSAKKEIEGHRVRSKELSKKMAELTAEIDALEVEMNKIPVKMNLLGTISHAKRASWLRYLNNAGKEENRKQCDAVFQNFRKIYLRDESGIAGEKDLLNSIKLSELKNSLSRNLNTAALTLLLMLISFTGSFAQKQWVVAVDLSDRLVTTPHCAENDQEVILKTFQKFDATVRSQLIIKSDDIFSVHILPQKDSPLDGVLYQKRLTLNMADLAIGQKATSLEKFKAQLPALLREVYQKARFSKLPSQYKGVDLWLYFNNVVPFVNPAGYRTELVVLTDGHFDFESYEHTAQYRNLYTHSKFIQTLHGPDWKKQAEKKGLGILPTTKKTFGVTASIVGMNAKTQDLFEMDKLRYFWAKWLAACGINSYQFS
jgi:uncharacterized membrane-anchored protein YhcB (DUF1043 family)